MKILKSLKIIVALVSISSLFAGSVSAEEIQMMQLAQRPKNAYQASDLIKNGMQEIFGATSESGVTAAKILFTKKALLWEGEDQDQLGVELKKKNILMVEYQIKF